MIGTAVSKNGVPIRLTEERWFHIVENHDELAGLSDEVLLTVEDPDYIVRGWIDELLAVKISMINIWLQFTKNLRTMVSHVHSTACHHEVTCI